tara:strand:+ start:423 stop:1145 length:723 start_codon:yes stop_codon:yes gene_type:complete
MGPGPNKLKSLKTANNHKKTIVIGLIAVILVVLALFRLDPNIWESRERLQSLVYLFLLLLLIGPALLLSRPFENLRYLALWTIVLLVLAYGYTAWRTNSINPYHLVGALAPQRDSAGLMGKAQFFANNNGEFLVTGLVNDVEILFLVDTGASDVVLTTHDAQRVGMIPDDMVFSRLYRTANGTVYGAPVRLSAVTVGGVRVKNVRASVSGGSLHRSLLGMSYLSRISEFSVRDQVLTLHE